LQPSGRSDEPLLLTTLPQFPDPRDVVKLKKAGAEVPHWQGNPPQAAAYAEPAASETSAMVPSTNEPDLFNMSMPPVSFDGAAPVTRLGSSKTSEEFLPLEVFVNPQNTAPGSQGEWATKPTRAVRLVTCQTESAIASEGWR